MTRKIVPLLPAVMCAAGLLPLNLQAQDDALALEEIIVTAQKREQSLQDVPIAITALSQEAMASQNIYDALDLQKAIPSLSIQKGYNRASQVPVIIRGIGTIASQPAFEGSVGSYVDGVYRSRPGMVLVSMLDIGAVEVLRGPQGTLFGKNTTAGALTMTSNTPQEEFGYGAEVTLGDFERRRVVGHVTGALGDSVAGRLALLKDQRDGYTEALFEHADYDDRDTFAAKGSLQWDASEQLAVKLIVDYSDSKEVCCFGNPATYNRAMSLTGGPLNDYYREAAQANFDTDIDLLDLDPNDRQNQNNVEPRSDNEEHGLALDVAYELPFATLRSITGYRDWDYSSQGDFDFGPVDIGELLEAYEVDSFSQEYNLTGTIGEISVFDSIDYVGGLFYAHEDYQQYRAFDAGADQAGIWERFWPARAEAPESALRELLGGGDWAAEGMVIGEVLHDLETETFAAFVHLNAALNDQLSLILGLRYTDEEKTLDRRNLLFSDVADYSAYLQKYMLGGYVLGANIAGPDIDGLKYRDDEWTYDIKFQYALSDTAQVYGGFSRGFKSGGIGMDPEAGGGQPSGQNSAILLELVSLGNGTGFADLEDPTYEPEYIDTWEIGLKTDYMGGRGRVNVAAFYNELEDNQFSVFTGTGFRVLNASSAEVSGVEVENFFAVTENLRLGASVTWLDTQYGDDIPDPAPPGRELTLAPEWAGVLNVSYERPVSDALSAFVNANWTYRGEQFLAYDIQDQHDEYTLLGLQLGVRGEEGHWDLRVWCDNCLDERYGTGFFNQPFYFDDEFEQYQAQFLGPPRVYGVTLNVNY